MSLALRLGPILVIRAIVQDHVVVDELDITGLELDVEIVGRVVGQRVEQVERFDLLCGQPGRVGKTLR